jgi:hypothetical protein
MTVQSNLQRVFVSVAFAVLLLPFLTFNSNFIQNSIITAGIPLGIFYYPRSYSASESLLNIGDYFSGNVANNDISAEFIMLADLFQRISYKYLGENIVVSYKVLSLCYLSIWIYFLSQLTQSSNSPTSIRAYVLTATGLLIFFNTESNFNENYNFSRIISPQFSILIWIVFVYLIYLYFRYQKLQNRQLKILLTLPFMLFVSSATYLFSFLSILGTSIVFLLYLVREKKTKHVLMLIPMGLLSICPFTYNAYSNIGSAEFSQVLTRMGLLESRLPGGIRNLAICAIVFFLIHVAQKIPSNQLSNSEFKLTLMISNTGLLLAGLSNVITGKSIQFYHFETYSLVLLLVVLVKILSLVLDYISIRIKVPRNSQYLVITIPLFSLLVQVSTLDYDFNNPYREFFVKNFKNDDNLIVDVENLKYSIPIYSNSKVLYQGDIIAYGFSDKEIMIRYFLTTGCSDIEQVRLIPGLFEYQGEPLYQKGKQVFRYLSYLNLENEFTHLYLPLLKKASEVRRKNEAVIQNFITEYRNYNCFQLAREYDIDYIVFEEKSNWNKIPNELQIFTYKVDKKKLFVAKI